jgi:hypothetical protein
LSIRTVPPLPSFSVAFGNLQDAAATDHGIAEYRIDAMIFADGQHAARANVHRAGNVLSVLHRKGVTGSDIQHTTGKVVERSLPGRVGGIYIDRAGIVDLADLARHIADERPAGC